MTGSGDPRAEEIFFRALEIRAEERPRLLKEECGDDAALRTEVESLLEAHQRGGEFLGTEGLRRQRDEAARSAFTEEPDDTRGNDS
jgi:hypothetical protein